MKQLNDQYYTYRQTPVDYDGVARPSIKGNTLVWNQLVQNGNFADTSTWSTSGGSTFSVSNNVGTFKASAQYQSINQPIYNIPVGHKLLGVCDIKGYIGSEIYFMLRCVKNGSVVKTERALITTTKQRLFVLMETVDNSYIQFIIQDNNASGWGNIELSNAMLTDLTVLNDSHITDYNSFINYFSLPYYAHGQYLLNFNGTGIKTTGKNLVFKTIEGAYISSGGQILSTTANDMVVAQVIQGQTYSFTFSTTGTATFAGFFYTEPSMNSYDYNGTRERYENGSFVAPITGYVAIRVEKNVDCMVNLGSTLLPYEPYTSSTLSLPISTYFPTGMKSAGSVYDELSDKAITRVGSVDLGSLTWTYTSNFFMGSGIEDSVKLPSSASVIPNIVCSLYTTSTQNQLTNADKHICIAIFNSRVLVYDTSYTDASTFKSAMSGVYLNYELATYTEQDVDPIYYNFYGNGTEELLPVNTDTPTTSPLLADIIYYNLTDSEVPYRVFWAINSKGDRWDFTEREFKSFMNNPQGLGFSKTISVNRYGNVQNLTDITDNFPQPNGEILFYDSSNSTRYDKYNQFVKFLSYEPITLYYKIPVSFYSRIPNTYSLECVVGTLTKTESKTDNMMNCSITYNALSFYKGEEVEISGTGLTYTINNDGDFPVGFEIEINATYNFYMKNPYIQLSQDGSLYGEAKFIDDTRFNKVYINSKDGEQNIILQQSGSVLPNPMSYQDLSISNGNIYVTFVKLARGETTLTIGADSQNITDVTIKYTPIYRSV